MKTEKLTAGEVERAAAILRRGGLLGIPTETVYGLGANGLDPEALLACGARLAYVSPSSPVSSAKRESTTG